MIIQRYGDLEVGITREVATRWSPFINPTSLYTAIIMGVGHGDFHPVAAQYGGGSLQQRMAVLLRDVSAGRDLLRPPAGWQRLGGLPTANPDRPASIWRPVPPPGYVALGDIASLEQPGSWVACVKQVHNGRAYVRQGEAGGLLWESAGVRLWSVVPPPYPDGDLDERLFLPVGAFTVVSTAGRPNPTPTTWILDLPAAVERGPGPGIPVLTSHSRPPAQTRVTDRTVTVPYFMVDDPNRSVDWRIDNSPFYRIRRHRNFDLVLFRDNRAGTVAQTEAEEITTGVTHEAGTSFSVTTGITVGTSVGVEASAKPFGVGASTTVTASVSASLEVGYETRRNVAVLSEQKKTRGLVIPPHSTGCLWMERHELVPVRADGSVLSAQAALGFRTDYYVTGEFPGGTGVIPFTSDASGTRTALPATHLPPFSTFPRTAAGASLPDTPTDPGEPAGGQ
ncbi:hypothetical protein [Actinacidiphila sp. ITFR-21]|uniref:hypothetical protein n=1 Tax=Actinacidiphila sp. ITFR-21 TaxID=3075199 RepID=UPI00288B08DD|nr:hypothetical protein [Streptomyces sp. ITFR-21]WNI14220.1 hypothetical protein RLT57_00870 [Streptomyces sp. ITFR-21]